jgi:hypothetical protein
VTSRFFIAHTMNLKLTVPIEHEGGVGGADGHILPSQPPSNIAQGFHDANYNTTVFPGTQAPTPETLVESSSAYGEPNTYPMPQYGGFGPEPMQMGHSGGPPHGGHADPIAAGRNFVPAIQPNMRHLAGGRDIIHFGNMTNLELEDMDFGLLDSYNDMFMSTLGHGAGMQMELPHPPQSISPTPSLEPPTLALKQLAIGASAYQRSHLRWTPTHERGNDETKDLAVPTDLGSRIKMHWRAIQGQVDQNARDRILAVVVSTCNFQNRMQAVASFPATGLLDNLMNLYFHNQREQPDAWIHPGTFYPATASPELLTMIVAAGAVLTPVRAVRKWGYALQEGVRNSLAQTFESSNSKTRDLETVCAFMLQIEISLWSGNKRKIEIAESFRGVMATMLRRAGRFKRAQYPPIHPLPHDTGEVLEAKWKEWAKQQQFLRLAYHLLLYDSKESISYLVNPIISCSEFSLPLPESRALFFAPTAQDWKNLYLSTTITPDVRMPSFIDSIHDFPGLNLPPEISGAHIDLEFTELATLFGLWGQLWEYRQRQSIRRNPQQRPPAPLLQHLNKNLLNPRFQSPHCRVLLELLGMTVYVSLEDLQAFAGKEDEEESLRVLPIVQAWIQGPESRHAVWHAGQLLREARTIRGGGLTEFWAVAVYHASLTLWAYGVLMKMVVTPVATPTGMEEELEVVYLDGIDTQAAERFIEYNRGRPRICGFQSNQADVDVRCPGQVMRGVAALLRRNHALGPNPADEAVPPPLVENLTQLMEELGDAAEGRQLSV